MKSLINALFFYALIAVGLSSQCGQGCFECDSPTNKCMACLQKYQLTILGGCVKDGIENCNLYLNSTYCLSCSPTYQLDSNQCLKDQSGCFRNITDKRCGACSPELKLLNGTCNGIFNCINYTNICLECDQGFTLLDNTCIANRENCKIVNRLSGVCIKCQDSYALVGYKCISNVYYNPNCELYDSKGRCLLCKQGFSLNENNCFGKKQLLLLQELNTQYNVNQSQTVAKNLALANSSAVSLKSKYCKTLDKRQCIECFSNFHLKDGVCESNNPLCRQIYSNGSCKSCYVGYALQQGDCVQTKKQSLGQNIVAASKLALKFKQQSDPFCQQYTASICISCKDGYYLNSQKICQKSNDNCLSYHEGSGLCRVCITPYVLIHSQCVYAIANCLLYDQNNNCFQCSLGFYLKDKVCYPNDVTCAKYDMVGSCIQCVDTYYLVNRQCVFPALGYDQYCLSYANSYCTYCLIGYYLDNYRCVQVDPRCSAFNYTSNLCLGCLGSMQANGAVCI